MPYIKQENRPDMDLVVKTMCDGKIEVENFSFILSLVEPKSITLQLRSMPTEIAKVITIMREMKVQANGDLNYILYKYCLMTVKPSYNNYKKYIGVLEDVSWKTSLPNNWRWELKECAAEIRRRILSKYEDKKCKVNGDVTSEL